jgi:hypothetical protein
LCVLLLINFLQINVFTNLVEIDIRQQGADDTPLWRSFVAVADVFSFHDSGIQPLADQPQDSTIVDPALDELPQPAPVQVVERLHDTIPTTKTLRATRNG